MSIPKELSRDPVRFDSVDALRAIGGTRVIDALAGRSIPVSGTSSFSNKPVVGHEARNVQHFRAAQEAEMGIVGSSGLDGSGSALSADRLVSVLDTNIVDTINPLFYMFFYLLFELRKRFGNNCAPNFRRRSGPTLRPPVESVLSRSPS